MKTQDAIQSQYLAALKMLKEAIVKCPPTVWDAAQDKDKAWFKVHHTLYWTHRFVQGTNRGFVRWKGHRHPNSRKPVSKPEMLEYLAFIQQQLAGDGLAFQQEKLERAISGIRHIQQHTGELYERLGTRKKITLTWTEEVHRKTK